MIDEAEEQRVKLVHEYYGVTTEPPAHDTRTRKALLREHEHITRQIHHSLGMGWAFCGVTVGKLIKERRYHQRRLIDLWDRDNKIKDIIWA